MADTLVGFGLGLTGTPKDYTSIVAARERQKGIEEAKKREEEQKQYKDYIDATVVKEHMNYKTNEIPIFLAKTLEEFQKAKESGSYLGMAMAKQKAASYIGTSKIESEEWGNLRKNIQSGKQIIDADIDAIDKATSAQDIVNLNPAAAQYDPNSQRINWLAVDKVNFPQHYMKIVNESPKIASGKKIPWTGPGGYKTELGELETDPIQYQARLNSSWELDPSLQKNAEIEYKAKNGWLGKTADQISAMTGQTITDQDINNEAKKLYIENGLKFIETDFKNLKNPPVAPKTSVYVSTATEGPKAFGAPSVGGSSFGRVKYKSDGKIDRSFSYEIPDIKQMSFDVIKSLTTTADIRNRNTGIKYEPNAVSDAEWGAFEVVPIYNNNIGPQFVGMIATDEEARNPDNKNKIDWKVMAVGKAKAAKFDPDANGGKGGFVLDENDNYVMDDASVYAPADKVKTLLKQKLTRTQVPEFERYWDELQRDAEDKNAQLRGGGGSRSTPPTGGGGGGGKYGKYKR